MPAPHPLKMFFSFGNPFAPQRSILSQFQSFFANPYLRFEQAPSSESEARPDQQESFFNPKLKRAPSKPKPKEQYKPHQSLYWKQLGNEAFYGCQFQTALQHYDKAIEIDSTNSVVHSNKARVLKQLGRLEEGLKSAQEAMELDETNFKSHLVAGQILAELSKSEPSTQKLQLALVRLRKALTLYSSQKGEQRVGEINTYIYRAKKLLWFKQFEQAKDLKRTVAQNFKDYVEADTSITPEEKSRRLQSFLESNNQCFTFNIPDYLICKITYEIMEDPVTLESGQTYERQAILEHLERNGLQDPISRQPVSGKLYPNQGIRQAIKQFLDQNPWAFEYVQGQSSKDIDF